VVHYQVLVPFKCSLGRGGLDTILPFNIFARSGQLDTITNALAFGHSCAFGTLHTTSILDLFENIKKKKKKNFKKKKKKKKKRVGKSINTKGGIGIVTKV